MKLTKDKLIQIILEELNEMPMRPGPLTRPGPGYTMDDISKVFLKMMDMYEALEEQGPEAQESFENTLSSRFDNMVKEWRRERAGESPFDPSYLSRK